MNRFRFFHSWFGVRGRKRAGSLIDSFMSLGSADRIGGVDKHALDMFVIEQARAIDELIDHPGRETGRWSVSLHGPFGGNHQWTSNVFPPTNSGGRVSRSSFPSASSLVFEFS